ncbi:MAG: hypothetical protein MUE55_04620 [Thermoplasmata archaeon]|jgi:hypothetical protein|nr:hypothetical protein [Thermoplasmata archaeon]
MRDMEFRWTKATVLMTMFAVILSLSSLLAKWYSCRFWWVTETGVVERENDFYLSGVSGGGGITSFDFSGFTEIGDVIGLSAILIVLWALATLPYISAVLDGESGFAWGWVVLALSVGSMANYALFIQSAAESTTSVNVDSGLTLGPLATSIAVIIQAGAVLARNLQVINPRLSAGPAKLSSEEIARGDLPER